LEVGTFESFYDKKHSLKCCSALHFIACVSCCCGVLGCPHVWVSLRMVAWDLSSIQTCVVARPLDRDVQVQGSLPPLFRVPGSVCLLRVAKVESPSRVSIFLQSKVVLHPTFEWKTKSARERWRE
jgi:hypothetical protein